MINPFYYEFSNILNKISNFTLEPFIVSMVILILSSLILSKKVTIVKDSADTALSSFIFIIPLFFGILYERGIFPTPDFEILWWSIFILLILLNFYNAFVYNNKNIIDAFTSLFLRAFISFSALYIFAKFMKQEGFLLQLLFFLLMIFFIYIGGFIFKGKRVLEGDFRLSFSYFLGEKIFFYGFLIFALDSLLFGHGFWLSVKFFLSAFLLKIIFWGLLYISAKQHFSCLLRKLTSDWREYKITILRNKYINAFAYFSGGKAIAVTDEAVKMLTVNELNFAFAHEVAHHKKNHLLVQIFSKLALFGGIKLLGFLGVTLPLQILAFGVAHIGLKAVHKKEEHEADTMAVEMLNEAGITQRGAITFFERILEDEPKNKKFLHKLRYLFLDDHPWVEERLENVKSLFRF